MLIFELSGITGIWVTNLDEDKTILHFDHWQWWILGEANKAVALGPFFWVPPSILGPPSKIAHIVSFRCRCFLEIIIKSGRKVRNTRSIRDEDFFF